MPSVSNSVRVKQGSCSTWEPVGPVPAVEAGAGRALRAAMAPNVTGTTTIHSYRECSQAGRRVACAAAWSSWCRLQSPPCALLATEQPRAHCVVTGHANGPENGEQGTQPPPPPRPPCTRHAPAAAVYKNCTNLVSSGVEMNVTLMEGADALTNYTVAGYVSMGASHGDGREAARQGPVGQQASCPRPPSPFRPCGPTARGAPLPPPRLKAACPGQRAPPPPALLRPCPGRRLRRGHRARVLAERHGPQRH